MLATQNLLNDFLHVFQVVSNGETVSSPTDHLLQAVSMRASVVSPVSDPRHSLCLEVLSDPTRTNRRHGR